MLFEGSGVALVTPFNEDLSVNYEKLEELIEYHIQNKTDAIIVCGTTGESATLSSEEKRKIIKFSVNKARSRVPIIAGCGSNDTKKAIKMSNDAKEAKADGLLIVTPYYNKCSDDGIFMHYKTIAQNVNLPIILYNVPSRTGVNINPETAIKLSKISNICGIKEASSNISQIMKICAIAPKDFYIYSGNDDQILPVLSAGGKGVISVVANIFPEKIHELCYSFFNGNIEKARYIQFKYLNLISNLFIDVNPIPIKEAMNYLDFEVGGLRLPLTNMNTEKSNILKKSILNLYEKK